MTARKKAAASRKRKSGSKTIRGAGKRKKAAAKKRSATRKSPKKSPKKSLKKSVKKSPRKSPKKASSKKASPKTARKRSAVKRGASAKGENSGKGAKSTRPGATQRRVFFFGARRVDGNAGMREILGGKGANLAEMTALGIPVPPGFTISTEVCGGGGGLTSPRI